jgi:hypothetical protein
MSVTSTSNRDSAVRIATACGLEDQGSEFESRWGQEFHILHVVQTYSGFSLLSQPNPFLPIILQLPIPKTQLSSILLLPSSYPGRLVSETRLTLLKWTFYNHFARTTQKMQSLYCWEGVFTEPLQSNGSYWTVVYIFVAAVRCLRIRCLAMNVYSDFTITDFGRHVIPVIFGVISEREQDTKPNTLMKNKNIWSKCKL